MKKCFALLLLTIQIITIGVASAEAADFPQSILVTKYEERFSKEKKIPQDRTVTIVPTWNNGKCTFVDAEGNLVYSYTPYVAPQKSRARELIDEAYMPLPENGNYYERLYASKSTTGFEQYGFLTAAWAKASNYTVETSLTIGWTHSGSVDLPLKRSVVAHYSLSYEKSTASSIGTDIPADPTKYSKLGVFVQYIKNDISFQIYLERDGAVVRNEWEYGMTKNPNDFRIDPVYNGNME